MTAPKRSLVAVRNEPLPSAGAVDPDEELERALALAVHPTDLDPELNERLIALAVGGPLDASHASPPATRELAAAALLRAALDGEPALTEHRALVDELVAAWRPTAIAPAVNDVLVGRHVRRARWLRTTLAPAFALAAVAAAVVFTWSPARGPREGLPRAAAIELSLARSTTDLFDPAEAFPRAGGESARVDRIADARIAEFRSNRFARWGVR
jgi:hypothetical protein